MVVLWRLRALHDHSESIRDLKADHRYLLLGLVAVSLRADDPDDLLLPLELPEPRLRIVSVAVITSRSTSPLMSSAGSAVVNRDLSSPSLNIA
jgi:hypothetical protein